MFRFAKNYFMACALFFAFNLGAIFQAWVDVPIEVSWVRVAVSVFAVAFFLAVADSFRQVLTMERQSRRDP